jgi:hypothetical protein
MRTGYELMEKIHNLFFFHNCNSTNQTQLFVVDLRDSSIHHTTKLAAQACVGLYNRQQSIATVAYTLLNEPYDDFWRKQLNLEPEYLNGTIFLLRCLQDFPRRIRCSYNGAARHVVPNDITVGSILEAIPLQDDEPIFNKVDPTNLSIVFDAITHSLFAANIERNATKYVYDAYAKNTTSIAKLNPGYSTSSFTPTSENDYHPPMINDMDISLVDFVYSERLFAFFLYYGCIPGRNPGWSENEYKLVTRMSATKLVGIGQIPFQ